MNIKGEKGILELKSEKLKEEMEKPEGERNLHKIKRLEKSIKRHKKAMERYVLAKEKKLRKERVTRMSQQSKHVRRHLKKEVRHQWEKILKG